MVKPGDWPTLVSLECHVPVERQDELVQIMKGAFGDKLVEGELNAMTESTVTPRELRGRIVLMVGTKSKFSKIQI
jgi:phosphatidylinositol phospholipase C delta